MLIELLVVVLGVALGGLGAASVLWTRAERDVTAWIEAPPRPGPTLILSAPIRLTVGDAVDLDALSKDLLAAGFERVDGRPGDDQLQREASTLRVRIRGGRAPHPGPPATVGLATITEREGRIAAIDPAEIVLPPTVLARLGDLDAGRDRLPLRELGPNAPRAVLAIEDARFRQHLGVDPIGLTRAMLHNAASPDRLHGGSTLTQQLAKNLFLTQERTARRKVRELFGALALERRFSKDELLEIYLNEVYLGQVGGVPILGVDQAARAWFGVSAARLSLAQAAVIAGAISAPNALSPVRHPERASQRAAAVLDRIEAVGSATPEELAAARAEPLRLGGVVTGGARLAPWAVDAAIEQADRALGPGELRTGGYRVYTTIQPHLQRAVERAVRGGLSEVQGAHSSVADAQAALVAVRALDGAIVALVGSRDYAESPFDRASQAAREVGSTVKPLTLAAVLDADPNLHAASTVVDEPISRKIDGKPWTPRNYDNRFLGEMTLRTVVEQSRNVPAVKMAEHLGPVALQRALRAMGLEGATNLPSAALGAFPATPLQLAGAYTVFAGGGDVASPHLVSAIHDARGIPIIALTPPRSAAISARAAAMSTEVLKGVLTDGTGRRAARYGVSGQVGAKTGTTNEGRDAWVAGTTPGYAIVAWVGRDRGTPLGLSGGQAALPIWARFVADSGVRGGQFPAPPGLVREPICRDSGRLARDACPDRVHEVFAKGGVPRGRCDVHGGPLVEAGGLLRKLFSRNKDPSVMGEGDDADLTAE